MLSIKYLKAAEHGTLRFATHPSLSQPLAGDSGELHINRGSLCLLDGFPANQPILLYEEWLLTSLLYAESQVDHPTPTVRMRARVLMTDLENAVEEVMRWKAREWERQRACGECYGLQGQTELVATGQSALLVMLCYAYLRYDR